jgi:hypothetical protein
MNQSIDSDQSSDIPADHSSDFWYNWSPVLDGMIIARRANYLQDQEASIAQG